MLWVPVSEMVDWQDNYWHFLNSFFVLWVVRCGGTVVWVVWVVSDWIGCALE
jgi:hypothetical protein